MFTIPGWTYEFHGYKCLATPNDLRTGMTAPDEMIIDISEVFDYNYAEPPYSFSSFVCEECGETVVEKYDRIKDEKKVCIDCMNKLNG